MAFPTRQDRAVVLAAGFLCCAVGDESGAPARTLVRPGLYRATRSTVERSPDGSSRSGPERSGFRAPTARPRSYRLTRLVKLSRETSLPLPACPNSRT